MFSVALCPCVSKSKFWNKLTTFAQITLKTPEHRWTQVRGPEYGCRQSLF